MGLDSMLPRANTILPRSASGFPFRQGETRSDRVLSEDVEGAERAKQPLSFQQGKSRERGATKAINTRASGGTEDSISDAP